MLANKTPIKFKLQRKSVAILLPLLIMSFAVLNIHVEAAAQDNNSKKAEQQNPTTTKVEQQEQPTNASSKNETITAEQKAVLKKFKSITITRPESETIPVAVVEVKPKFQNGDENEFTKWVAQHMTYPEEAKDKKIQGRVICSFVVDENGKVIDAKVLRGVNPILDSVAVNLISASPDWTPGKHKKKNVAVKYTFPIIFQLR